jgi:uncharacterized protein YndB with AHSA1/START domain
MGRQIKVDLERTIPAPPARVHAALADYRGRERILPGNYLDYRVEEGGDGGGTVVSYRLRAGRRERRYVMEVAEPTPGVTLVERDRESSLITTWILSPTASGHRHRSQAVDDLGGPRRHRRPLRARLRPPGAAPHPRRAARPPDPAAGGRAAQLSAR